MDRELVQYLEQKFLSQEQQLRGLLDQRFQAVDRRFEQIDHQFVELRQEMRAGQEEVKRHNGILVEDLRCQVQLVAEGLMTHIDVRHAEDRAYNDEHFRENRALFKLCFQRIENPERKGQG